VEAATIPAALAPGAVEQASDAVKKPADLFRWSGYVHVGAGAEDCPDGLNGMCGNPAHFHAFCRLPNQFQHSDIRTKAMAAKARRIRLLRDPESDPALILEAEMDELARTGDREALVDELLNRDWWKDHIAAMRDVEAEERFAHIQQDRERLEQLDAMSPERRDNNEREELLRHIGAYNELVERRRKEAQAPRRSALDGLDMHELVAQAREDRIAAEGSAAFMETYSKWEWYACTFKTSNGRPTERVFATIEALELADGEVLEAVGALFSNLEAAFQRGPTGNS
jgi:hypothetical protein